MSDINKRFHEIVLKSEFFKGHSGWYFSYLKSEKIAHVLALLAQQSSAQELKDLTDRAINLSEEILQFVAGRESLQKVLADIFTLISRLRVATTAGIVTQNNAFILVSEYEQVAEKLSIPSTRQSPLSSADFMVPPIADDRDPTPLLSLPVSDFSDLPTPVKDNKGHIPVKDRNVLKNQTGSRTSLILETVRKNKGISIKDISSVVRDCSEKTIQRELGGLIDQGLVKKVGERRWSIYFATSQA